MILRILRGGAGPGIAGTSSGRVQVDAGQECGEFGGGHLEAVGPDGRESESPAFKPLGPDGHPIAVPMEDLDAIAPLVDEDEEMTGEGIESQAARRQGGQAVKALAHVGRSFGEVDADRGAQSEHGCPSTTAMRWRRVWGSNPGATAIRRPLDRMSSRWGPEAVLGGMGSGRIATGRKRWSALAEGRSSLGMRSAGAGW